MESKYLRRISDKVLESALSSFGAVLIEGPKWCGKTRTAKEKCKSSLFMQDPDYTSSYLKAADTKPSLLLKGDVPRLIDEWQMAHVLWDAVRFEVDKRNENGQFVLTGSAVPKDNVVVHTGTGRITRMIMRTMSLYESEESNGSVSLRDLFDGKKEIEAVSTLTIEKIAMAIVRGGWPAAILDNEQIAIKKANDYVEAIINYDVSSVDGIEKSPARVRAIMRSLARNVATLATLETIKNDIASDDNAISDKTISQYINALRRIFVVEDLPAWSPALRSATLMRTSSKRFFIDPSIASSVLRISSNKLLEDFNTFGFLFESLCIRDLRVYAQSLDGDVFYYQDRNGLEVDAIIHLHDGRWGAVEIKLGSKEIEKACLNLIKLKEKINLEKMQEPSFLMVLTCSEYGYVTKEGVSIVPIGCLKD